jgi:succinyl-CoA synthetase alpha subunit
VPVTYAADAILEALDAEVGLIIYITEDISVLDMIKVKRALESYKNLLIGLNCSPSQCKIDIMPGSIHTLGSIGIVSRFGTLK